MHPLLSWRSRVLLLALCALFSVSFSPVDAQTTPASPFGIKLLPGRKAFLRGEKNAVLKLEVSNNGAVPLKKVTLKISAPNLNLPQQWEVLEQGTKRILDIPLPTLLRAGEYSGRAEVQAEGGLKTQQEFSFTIANRLPDRLPVMLWGSVDTPYITHDKLRANGFTRVFDLYDLDVQAVLDSGKPLVADPQDKWVQRSWKKLDDALARGLELGATYNEPTYYLEKQEKYLRVGRDGKPNTAKPNVMGLNPDVIRFAENIGESAANWYREYPAWTHALIFSEARDAADVSFSPLERDAYKKWSSGQEIPANVENKYVCYYKDIAGFPTNRVIPDKYPIMEYYRWFWTQGDGWIGLVDAAAQGIHQARPDVVTWNDPTLRSPSLYGMGGHNTMIGQWTYTNPDPLKLAMTMDELQRMAQGGRKTIGKPYQTFQMMQLIWYGSEVVTSDQNGGRKSEFHDHDPNAVYITPSPDNFREAFWVLLTRPNDMIGYHGQQALWPSNGTHVYKYTNPQTQYELRRMHTEVVTPLGATLKKVGARKHDVAWLESFSSQILGWRGTWGWSSNELGSRYRALSHAGLQSDIVYEESILDEGLDQYKVLLLLGCDVLPQSVYEKIVAWQKRGGFIIGDKDTCPAIVPDYVVKSYSDEQIMTMKKRPDRSLEKPLILQFARELQAALKGRYASFVASDDLEIVPYARQNGEVDYLFAINDHRKFGDYVGQYGMMQEDGVAAAGKVRVARAAKAAYDLVKGGKVGLTSAGNASTLALTFEPADGKLIALTNQEIGALEITAPPSAKAGSTLPLNFQLQDTANKPMRGVWPIKIEILDPAGREAEWSGFYGAQNGNVKINWDVAPNDISGVWTIRATDWATRKTTSKTIHISGGQNLSAGEIEMEKKNYLAALAALTVATALPPATAKADPNRNLSTPPKPAVTTPAVPVAEVPKVATLPADAPAGATLVTENPSFEDELKGWSTWIGGAGAGTIEASQEMARTGRGSAVATGVFRGGVYDIVPWAAGKYRMIVRVRVPDGQAAKGKATLVANISDEKAANAGFERFESEALQVAPGEWRELKLDFELKSDFEGKAKTITLLTIFDGFENNEKIYVDDFGIYRLP
jgi:hypothetical protein